MGWGQASFFGGLADTDLILTQIEQMFETGMVAISGGEHQYMAGYNAGRTCALTTGSVEAGRRWLAEHLGADSAFVAGYEWALWDYEDANGLSHTSGRDTAIG